MAAVPVTPKVAEIAHAIANDLAPSIDADVLRILKVVKFLRSRYPDASYEELKAAMDIAEEYRWDLIRETCADISVLF